MQQLPQFTASRLARYTESLRRELYDAVVAHIWTATVPGEYIPDYGPEDAQLTVMYTHGRWIALWVDLDEAADAPPDQRAVMSRILADPERPFGIQLSEI